MFKDLKYCKDCGKEISREEVENNIQCGYHNVCSICLPKKPRKIFISKPDFEKFRTKKEINSQE